MSEKFIGTVRVYPAHYQYHASPGFHPRERTARTDGEVTRCRHAGKYALRVVDPDQVAIERRDRGRCAHALDPLRRYHLAAVRLAVIEQQPADARLVEAADGHSAAPMGTSGD